MMNSKRKLIAASVVAVVAALAGYRYFGGTSETAQATASGTAEETHAATVPARPAISVVTIGQSVLRDRVRASGLVGAVERVLVQPQVEGQAIDAILAEVGDHVAAGQVLARLSDTALKLQKSQLAASRASALAMIAQADAQLIEAQAASDEARRNLDRAEQLRKQGNASQAAADQAATSATSANARVMVATQGAEAAKAQLELVDAQIENVQLQLSRTEIRAPFAGEVVEKNTVVGGIASAAGQPMFILVRDGRLELSADLAEQDLARVSNGLRVTLRAAGVRDDLTGTVRLVEPAIDTTTRLGRARVTIDQADLIRTGMFLEAEIEVSEREVLAVPITAIGTDDLGTFVMVVDDKGVVHRTSVVTGIRDGAQVELQSGVEQGQLVVAKAASFVREGDVVDPVPLAAVPVTN